MKTLALALVLAACAVPPSAPPVVPRASAHKAGEDHPPADLDSETLVRCLIDAPDGCSGCDRGDTCVYKQMKEYDCVYIVYGTKCE